MSIEDRNAKVRESWAKQASRYDNAVGFFERRVFGEEHRAWACSRASGDVLEVAVGTALNLEHYPPDVSPVGLDLSPEMLAIAGERALQVGRAISFVLGDAHVLPFQEASFDSVVCTYSLCNIPDPLVSVNEMKRVLRGGGKLILVDHIRSSVRPIYWFQKGIEFLTARRDGEHMTRRPLEQVEAAGFEIVERDRMKAGVIERLVAVKR